MPGHAHPCTRTQAHMHTLTLTLLHAYSLPSITLYLSPQSWFFPSVSCLFVLLFLVSGFISLGLFFLPSFSSLFPCSPPPSDVYSPTDDTSLHSPVPLPAPTAQHTLYLLYLIFTELFMLISLDNKYLPLC